MITITKDSYFIYSGGEVQLKKIELGSSKEVSITCLDYTMNGFMALAQCVEVLRRAGADHISLTYPYLPYARQDRVMDRGVPFSLKTFCNMLNALKLDVVKIYDPHSDVTPALINNCHVVHQHEIAWQVVPRILLTDPNVLLVSPDAGAFKKVAQIRQHLPEKIAIGVKTRDVATGKITSTSVVSPHIPIEGRDCLIVDDICDGGFTFVALAKALRAQGARSVYLYVTHGIFSKGFDELLSVIDEIYTTDSFKHDNLPIQVIAKGAF